jgi:hypothetical protein
VAFLTDLLAPRTKETEEQIMLSVFQDQKFRVTDWHVGAGARTMVKAIAALMLDKYQLAQVFAKSQLVKLAKDLKDAAGKDVEGWLDLIAEHFYDLKRSPATSTIERCKLTCLAGFGPININQGAFIAKASPSGNRYIYQGAPTVVVPDNGSVDIDLTAEEPGAKYSDPADSITEAVTSLPGLTISNPGTFFGGLDTAGKATKSQTAQGTGTVTPSAGSAPVQQRLYTITVISSGDAGTNGSIRVEYIAGGTITVLATVSPIPTTYTGIGDGITLTIANGAGAGFIAGDMFTFGTPGSPIVVQGVDKETNEALANRCIGRWPSLALNMVTDKWVAWIRQASLDSGFGIEKITPRPSAIEAGVTIVLVATASGAPPGGTITALQDYVNARLSIGDKGSVQSAVNKNLNLTFGDIWVRASEIVAVKAAADENWRRYVQALPIGGDLSTGSPGVVRVAELEQAIMDAGAVDLIDLQINGQPYNEQLLENEVPVIPAGQEPSAALNWISVA